jgi:hypothetical protein
VTPALALEKDDAHRAYLRGDFARAVSLLRESLGRAADGGSIDDRKRLALYLYGAGLLAEAMAGLGELRGLAPQDADIPENIGVVLGQLGELAGAVASLREAYALDPNRANVCDALAHSLSRLGNLAESQTFGRRALELKDAAAATLAAERWPLPDSPPPPFDGENPSANVIAFSLWGQEARYLVGALRNAVLARDLFPQWTCRFYHDASVPAATIRQLRSLGSQTLLRPRPETFYEGLMWRFEVIGDPGLRYFLVRDCDSVLNTKERVAVDAWLASGRWFHAMRDYPSHTEVLLAGLWGGANGVLPPLAELRRHFRPGTAPTRTFDQVFLRETVWPTARQSVLIHDSVYTGCLGSVPFPPGGDLPRGWHVGQNEAAIRSRQPVPPPAIPPGDACRFFLAASDEESLDRTRRLIEQSATHHCGGPVDLAAFAQKLALAAGELTLSPETGEPMLGRVFFEALDAVATPPPARAGATGGIALRGSLDPLPAILRGLPSARLLFVARDPEDLEFFPDRNRVGLKLEWAARLHCAEKLAEALPGRVTIVRATDLLGALDFDPVVASSPGQRCKQPSREAPLPADGLPA